MFETLVSVTQQWKTWKLLTIMSYMEYGASLINVDLGFGGPYRVFKGVCKKITFYIGTSGHKTTNCGTCQSYRSIAINIRPSSWQIADLPL